MVSPANTYTGLTTAGPGTAAGEPGKYYPTGKRNYARVVAQDEYQGAADAMLAQAARRQERVHPERQGGLRPRRRDEHAGTAAKKLGIKVAGFAAFDPKASDYRRSPRRSRARVRRACSSAA